MFMRNKINSLYQKSIKAHYFLCSFIILWVFYVFLYPSLSYNPQIWAEQGSNYLFYAYNKTFAQNIWKDDAGYLVWLPRLIALLFSALASPYWFIVICNLIALMLIAFFVSFINHHSLRILIASDEQRFFISLILGLCVLPHYEIFTYINFSYIGFLFITFLLFADKESLSNVQYIFCSVLVALLCISKFHFVLFMPFFIGFMIYHQRCSQKRSMQFYIPSLCTMLIQLLYVAISMKYTDSPANEYTMIDLGFKGLVITILRGILLYFTAYSTHFRFLYYMPLVHLAGLIVLAYFAYLIISSYKKQQICAKIFLSIIICNLIALSFALMASLNQFSVIKSIFLYNAPYSFGRQGFVIYDLVYLAIIIFLLNVKQLSWPNIKPAKNILLFTLIAFITCTTMPKTLYRDSHSIGLSDWKNLHVLLKNEKYYIPANPPEWGLAHGIYKGISFYKKYEADKGILNITDIADLQKKLAALIVQYPGETKLHAIAYNKNGQKIAQAEMLSDPKKDYKYLLFEPLPILAGGGQFADKILILDENNQPLENIFMSAVYVFDKEDKEKEL